MKILSACCNVECIRKGFKKLGGVSQPGHYNCPKCGKEHSRFNIIQNDSK